MWKVLLSAGMLAAAATSAASAADYYERDGYYGARPRVRALCEVNVTALVLGCPPQIIPPAAIADSLRSRYLELPAADLRRPYPQTYSWSR